MPRKRRFFLPNIPVHIVQRGHSRESVFFDEADYQAYLNWLSEALKRYGCALHAYVLMTNHIHLLVTPKDQQGISRMMQYIGRHYVPYINSTYGTSGSIWDGRFKASLIHDVEYLLACMRYIELNSARANMVKAPAHYRWSSYRCNAQGKLSEIITPHPLYNTLGRDMVGRCVGYKALFKAHVEDIEINDISAAWQTGTPLGNENFRDKLEQKLQLKLGQARRGRPSNPKQDSK